MLVRIMLKFENISKNKALGFNIRLYNKEERLIFLFSKLLFAQ